MIAVEELAVDAFRSAFGHTVVGSGRKEFLEQNAAFEIAEMFSDTFMDAVAVGEAARRTAMNIEDIGVLELGLIAIAGGPEKHHTLSGREPMPANFSFLLDDTSKQVSGLVKAQGFGESVGDQRGVLDDGALLIGMLFEREVVGRIRHRERDDLGARDEERVRGGDLTG